MSASDWRADVLKFWFGLAREQWWNGGSELDQRIKQTFLKLWVEKRQLPIEAFLSDPLTADAAVILFDQFPRNMLRGHADAYATDHMALAIAKAAIERGFDEQLQKDERKFLYMPFLHSENLDDQNHALLLFNTIDDQEQIAYAKKHRDIIARFGRFPHRNAILGRAPRSDEISAGKLDSF